MGSPIIVSGLGLGGVNLVKSPLAMDDSELVQAQNAEPYRERGVAGIRKRAALRPVNSSALSAIEGIVPAELTPSGAGDVIDGPGRNGVAGTVYILYGTTWRYSVDGGVNWADWLASMLGLLSGYGSQQLGGGSTTIKFDSYRPTTASTGTYTDGTLHGAGNAGAILGQTIVPATESANWIQVPGIVGDKRSISIVASTRAHVAHSSGDTHGAVAALVPTVYAHYYGGLGGGTDVQIFMRIGGTDYDIGSAQTLSGAADDDANVSQIALTSPATGIAWTLAEIEGAEYGIRITSNPGSNDVRLAGITAFVEMYVTTGGL